jgi:hypothetical protein
MAAYVRNKDKQWRAKPFEEGRALWRDSMAIFQEVAGSQERTAQKPPEVIRQLEHLTRQGAIPYRQVFRLAAFGICTDQAKIYFWRHETMPLPIAVLGDEDLLPDLHEALDAAEKAAGGLWHAVRRLAELISTSQPGSRADKDRVGQLARSLDADTRYWAGLETPFRKFLLDLPGEEAHREALLKEWTDTVCNRARRVFDQIVNGLDASPRTFRAVYTDDWGGQKTLNVELAKIADRDEATAQRRPA